MALLVSVIGYSQGSLVFHEDFELPSQADSVTSTGPTGWNVGSVLASQGTYSDSAKVMTSGANILTTNSMDLSAYSNVTLTFDHICKIEFFDSAKVEVSADNGVSWTTLTGNEYKGNSPYFNNNGYFNANAYTKWQPMSSVSPDNSWWKTESFDISSIAGSSASVQIRFVLKDGNSTTIFENIGWFVDDIQVKAANGEMNPPVIAVVSNPVDTAYTKGPFNVEVELTDDTGIDTAYIVYNVNGGTDNTVGFYHSNGNKWVADLPAGNYGDVYNYYIKVIDSSPVANSSRKPLNSRYSFELVQSPAPSGCTNPVTVFPMVENFDNNASAIDDNCGSFHILNGLFSNIPGDSVDWIPLRGETYSGSTGPMGDHTTDSTTYVYLESSSCKYKVGILESRCFDISNVNYPALEFYYHMKGGSIGELYVDIYFAGHWSTIWQKSGHQGGEWIRALVPLKKYKSVTKIRFRGKTGNGYNGDIALDDIRIGEPAPEDAGIFVIQEPKGTVNQLNNDIIVGLKNYGSADLTNVDITYTVNEVNPTTFSWTGLLKPGSVIDSLNIGSNVFSSGDAEIKAWSSNPNGISDTISSNDTAFVNATFCDGYIAGSYTIGSSAGADYPTLDDALTALKTCGMNAAVVFNMESGTYGKQDITDVMTASATNTITIQSATGNAADVVFEAAPTTSNTNFVLLLDGSSHFIFKNLTFKSTASTYGRVVEIDGNSNYNRFENCVLQGIPTTSTANSRAVVYSGDENSSYNEFVDCEINNGSYGILLEKSGWSGTGTSKGNLIQGNKITGFYKYGVGLEDNDTTKIIGNRLENASSSGSLYGIEIDDCYGLTIANNKILLDAQTSSDVYGMDIDGYGDMARYLDVYNNMISIQGATQDVIGVRLYTSDSVRLAYNTINVASGSASGGIGIYLDVNSSGHTGNILQNNIITNTGGGVAVEFDADAYSGQYVEISDYNGLYSSGNSLVRYGSQVKATLADWVAESGFETNSVFANPGFKAVDSLYASNPAFNGSATVLSYVTTDMTGQPRDNTAPDMGAVEFDPPANDLSVVAMSSPVNVCSGNSADVIVKFRNEGTNNISAAAIDWSINGTAKSSMGFGGTLAPGDDTLITLGQESFTYGTQYDIKVWVTSTNGNADDNHLNDTLLIEDFSTSLPGGTYTVGGSASDFSTLTDVAAYLNSYGICGAVTFDVAAGTYNEQFAIGEVAGSSAANTITIAGVSGDSSAVVIEYNVTDAGKAYVINLEKADYLTLKDVTVKNISSAGNVIRFGLGSNDLQFLNNHLVGVDTSSTNDDFAVIYAKAPGYIIDSNITISNNRIMNGSYGIYYEGVNGNDPSPATVITGNYIDNAYDKGILLEYHDAPVIKNNYVALHKTNNYSASAKLDQCDNDMVITGNHFINKNGSVALEVEYSDGAAGARSLIANNFIYAGGAGSSFYYGALNIDDGKYHDIYYNNIKYDGPDASAALYLDGAEEIRLKNNNITNMSGGLAVDVSYVSTHPLVASDNNNIYTTGSDLIDNDGSILSLAQWKTTGFGTASISVDPFFYGKYNLHVGNSALNAAATPIAQVNIDIDGDTRDASTPDIGADEFTPNGYNLGISEILTPVSGCDLTSAETITINITNVDMNNVTANLTASYKIKGSSNIVTENISQAVNSGDTVTYSFNATANLDVNTDSLITIIAWVSHPQDLLTFNDTSRISVINKETPADPAIADVNIPWQTAGQIVANSNYMTFWYDSLVNGTLLQIGDTFNTPVLMDTATYYVEYLNGEANIKFTEIQISDYYDGVTSPMPSYIQNGDAMIEITNMGTAPAVLKDYELVIYEQGYSTLDMDTYTLPDILLPAGQTMILDADAGTDDYQNFYFCMDLQTIGYMITSYDYGFVLKDVNGNYVDVVAYYDFDFAANTSVPASEWSSADGAYGSSSAGIIRVKSDNNNKDDWVPADDPSPIQTIGSVNPQLQSQVGGIACYSNRVPVKANVTGIPSNNAVLTDVDITSSGCGLTNEPMSVDIFNYAYQDINGNITANYQIIGSSNVISEAVSTVIAPDDTITYNFITPVDLTASTDSLFEIKVWVDLAGDTINQGDTMVVSVFNGALLAAPTASNVDVNYGSAANLTAASANPVYWYEDASATILAGKGYNFTTPVLYDTTTYYAQSVQEDGDTLATVMNGSKKKSGVMFNLTANGDLNVDSFAVNADTIAASTISVYYRKGGYQGHETNPSSWTLLGSEQLSTVPTWGQPVYVKPGILRMKSGITYGIYITTNSDTLNLRMSSGSVNASDNKLSLSSGPGVDYQFNPSASTYGFNGAVYYSTPVGCPSAAVAVDANVINAPANDAGIDSVVSPAGSVPLAANNNIEVLIHNYGTDTLTSVDVNYSIDGGSVQTFSWTGSLAPASVSQAVTVGSQSFGYGNHDIKIWTTNPNQQTDNFGANDTATSFFSSCISSGIYTIGPANGDFVDFSSAIAALNYCGIQGPVTFDVESGTYDEHIEFVGKITGSGFNDTITFRSATGNPADVVLRYDDTAASNNTNYVIYMDDAAHLRFMNMTLEAAGADYAKVFDVDDDNTDIRIVGNIIKGIAAGSYDSKRTLYYSAYTADSSIHIMNNTFINGYEAIRMSSSDKHYDIRVENNTFQEQYENAINVEDVTGVVINDNYIISTTSTDDYKAILLSESNAPVSIRRNTIWSLNSDEAIELDDCHGTQTDPVLMANNSVANEGTGNYGNRTLYITDCSYLDIYFNTFRNKSLLGTSTDVIYLASSTDINMLNNIFANMGEGYAITINSTVSNFNSDYNNFYTRSGEFLADKSYSDQKTLADWQNATFGDMNSVSVNPVFAGPQDNHVAHIALYGAGTPISGITTDMDGDLRRPQPAIGADEFTPPANDAGVVDISGPMSPVNAGTNDVYVDIRNFGGDTLSSATIQWSVNGVLQTAYSYIGNLPTADIQDSVLIGTYNFVAGPAVIKAWTVAPNGNTDAMASNDTAVVNLVTCTGPLSGSYTIGGSSADYGNFSQAVQALKYCGISGPVSFDVASGLYNEQISIDSITGISATDTVVFKSQSGVNTDVVLAFTTNKDDNYVVRLDKADYITFKDMTIKSEGVDYTRTVVLRNKANYNRFEGNRLIAPVANDDDEDMAVVFFDEDFNNEFNSFVNNEIIDGAFSMVIEGVNTASPASGNRIIGNTMTGGYDNAINAEYLDSLTIMNNHIEISNKGSYSYAVELDDIFESSVISHNYIHVKGNNHTRGLHVHGTEGTASSPVIIANNMIVQTEGSGDAYGIRLYSSEYVNVYYNTVSINNGNPTESAALYVYGSSTDPANNTNIANNIFANMNQGAVIDIEDDIVAAMAIGTFDNNNFYTAGSSFGEYNDIGITDFADFLTQSGTNANSVSADPAFVSSTDLHVNAALLNANAMVIAGITTDFDGDPRNATNPDIGADEFDPIPVDMGVVEIVKPAKTFNPSGFIADVQVVVKNFGADTMYGYSVEYKYGNQNPVVETLNDTVYPGYVDTVDFTNPLSTITGNKLFEVYTVVPNDGKNSNDTMSMYYQGLHTITPEWSHGFEGAVYFAHGGTPDLWQRGNPMGSNINTPHNGANVWMTDLDADYPANTDAFLYTPMIDFSGVQGATMEFWHALDTEQGLDGATVEFSLNGGVTWATLGDTTTTGTKTNWYTDVIGNMPVWTGSFGWTQSTFELSQFDNHPTPVQFRFRIYSDAQNHGDGWAIDDFAITLPTYPKDAGVVAINQPSGSTVIGDQVNVEVDIMNFGSDTLYNVPVSYEVNGNVQTETWTGTLHPNATATFAFAATYTSPNASYTITSYTELPNDGNASNDTTDALLNVSQPPLDAGITAIIQPGDTTAQFTSTTVTVRIQNFGTDVLTSIPVEYQQGSLTPVSETWTGNLAAGDSVDYTFSTPFTAGAGSISLCATTNLPGDYDASNDEVCKTIITTDIPENSIFGNVSIHPNPADEYAVLNLNNKVRGDVIISVTDMTGNMVYNKRFDLVEQTNSIRIQTANLPAGMYFVNLQSANDKASMKLIIKH